MRSLAATQPGASARRAPMASLLRAAAASRTRTVSVSATMKNSRTAELRRLLKGNDILLGPCCHDALSAKLIEQAGFPYAFMSGFCTAGARLGAPDTGLISYAEMLDTGRNIHEATHSMPIIGDGDTGYGNAMNVKRTVRGYAGAGFAGILIEDQVAPKSCGHVRGKRVVGREEAVSRIRAAVDARNEGADILIVARTDARQAVSLEEALWRAEAFAAAGADVLFIDALESEDEMRAFTRLGGAAASVPKMANMLEGGGKTPVLPPSALQAMGFKLVAYPLSLLGVSIRAMQDALEGLRRGRVPPVEALGTFADIQAAVGFPDYYAEEKRYAISSPTSSAASGPAHSSSAAPPPPPPPPPPSSSSSSSTYSSTTTRSPPVVEPVVVDEPGSSPSASWPLPKDTPRSSSSTASSSGSSSSSSYGSSSSYTSSVPSAPKAAPAEQQSSGSGAGGAGSDPNYRRNMSLRVRIADINTGVVKLETRVPAGFLNGLSALVPQVSGLNIQSMLEQAMGPGGVLPQPGQPLVNLNSGRDNIQIFLE
ncbi:hypothetical protein HYH02_000680 [Chlamydomonas schloesseri]|uniref:Isocitrate lyase n=1 Tax=Chlamydomonas schloesseri TaxID=2026947 RepID=A0A835WX88_9CHLO|nr:hypothetical protein HYH02_000680 [Chlamydomonas schloesseri]|eukprot:KAG2454848.1 hypothetical protein HYH02_000680 [Chlamydomonas schloesseri]